MNVWFEATVNESDRRQPIKVSLDGGLAELVQLPGVYRFPVDTDTERYSTEYRNFLTLDKI